MSERTYKSYWEWESPSKQTEYTEPTRLLDYDGTIIDTNRLIVDSWNHMYKEYCGGFLNLSAEDLAQ